jgi:hypothetical protein
MITIRIWVKFGVRVRVEVKVRVRVKNRVMVKIRVKVRNRIRVRIRVRVRVRVRAPGMTNSSKRYPSVVFCALWDDKKSSFWSKSKMADSIGSVSP